MPCCLLRLQVLQAELLEVQSEGLLAEASSEKMRRDAAVQHQREYENVSSTIVLEWLWRCLRAGMCYCMATRDAKVPAHGVCSWSHRSTPAPRRQRRSGARCAERSLHSAWWTPCLQPAED